jgi:hypothetical protein
MTSLVIADVLGLVATLLWVGFAVFVVLMLRPLLSLVQAVKPGGGKSEGGKSDEQESGGHADIAYAAAQLDHAVDHNGRPDVSGERRAHAVERAKRLQGMLGGARLVWVVDRPAAVTAESRLLQSLGILVAVVSTNSEVKAALNDGGVDVVISDLERSKGDPALALAGQTDDVPLIYYTTERTAGVPAGAFGLTDRPDELLHLVIDALERRRLPTTPSSPLPAQRRSPVTNGHRLRRLAHRLRPTTHAS